MPGQVDRAGALSNVRNGRPPTVTDAMCAPPGSRSRSESECLAIRGTLDRRADRMRRRETSVYESGPNPVGSRSTAMRLPGASQARGVA